MLNQAYMISASALALVAWTPSLAAAQPSGASTSEIEEVIVTAQRRGENLQDVPASITALTGGELSKAGVASTTDIALVTPGLVMQRSTMTTQPTIRGIGSRSATNGNEPNVAIYLDGVYQAQSFANLFELNDIERIEVLKGPQGTLYGRNATGGAINIVTKMPSFTPTGNFSVNYGTDNYRRASAYVSGPIIGDKVAGSLSAVGLKQDGYIRNVFLNKTVGERWLGSVRGKLLYQINEDAEVGFNFFNSNMADNAGNDWHPLNGNAIGRTLATNVPLNIRVPNGDYETALYFEPMLKVVSTHVGLNGRFNLGFADLSMVAAWRRNNGNGTYDTGGTVVSVTPVFIRPFSRGYWVESILSSNGDGRFSWIAGANFFADLSEVRQQRVGPTRAVYATRSRAASGFVEGTYKLLDNLSVTAGGRYNYDKKWATYSNLSTGQRNDGEKSWNGFVPRVVVKWKPAEGVNVYGSYSEGFKSGSFEASSLAGALTSSAVDPETVNAFEVGVKADVTPRLRLNAAAYHYDYKDLQIQAVVIVGSSSVGTLTNAASAKIKGFEAGGEFVVTDDLKLRGGIDVLDAKFGSFPNATVNEQRPLVNGGGVGNVTVTRDVTGKRLIRAPKYTINVGADYDHDFAGGTILGSVSYFLSAKYFIDPLNRVAQPRYNVLNASLGWRSASNVTFSVAGKNLTGAKYGVQTPVNANGDMVTYERGRQVIGGVSYSF